MYLIDAQLQKLLLMAIRCQMDRFCYSTFLTKYEMACHTETNIVFKRFIQWRQLKADTLGDWN